MCRHRWKAPSCTGRLRQPGVRSGTDLLLESIVYVGRDVDRVKVRRNLRIAPLDLGRGETQCSNLVQPRPPALCRSDLGGEGRADAGEVLALPNSRGVVVLVFLHSPMVDSTFEFLVSAAACYKNRTVASNGSVGRAHNVFN